MFDYAISRNRRPRLTGRTVSSYVTSGLLHALMILALFEYPSLLRGGMYHRFRALSMIADSLMPKPKNDDDKWRTVAVLQPQSKMMTPSAATLKKYLYDWNKKRRGNESPSIRIRFGDEQKAAINSLPPMPQVRQEPKVAELVLPANTLASGDASTSSAPGQSGSGAPVVSGRGVGLGVTPPEPAPPKSEMAENSVPKSIPSGITPPASTPPAPAGGFRVFETEQKAIYSPDSGIFDTKGFPLGEYVGHNEGCSLRSGAG